MIPRVVTTILARSTHLLATYQPTYQGLLLPKPCDVRLVKPVPRYLMDKIKRWTDVHPYMDRRGCIYTSHVSSQLECYLLRPGG